MNTISKRALAQALFASLVVAAIPARADDSTDKVAANTDADAKMVEVCANSPNGMVPTAKLKKALNRMLDMGETPAAAKLSKEEKRARQFDAFWKELKDESNRG